MLGRCVRLPCAVIPAHSGGVCVSHPHQLLHKQFLAMSSAVLPLCHLPLHVICPICKFHPSSLTPILSPSRLRLPPPLVLFLFLCRMQSCAWFSVRVRTDLGAVPAAACAVVAPGAQVNMLMEAVRVWCHLCPGVPDTACETHCG